MIKAIQTKYKGYKFRSRLEARWAVFFDALGIEWDYEPEGFELPDGTRYLPDFWLKRERVWVEIKGQEPTDDERMKCHFMADACERPVLLLSGTPGTRQLLTYGQTPTNKAQAFFGWNKPDRAFCHLAAWRYQEDFVDVGEHSLYGMLADKGFAFGISDHAPGRDRVDFLVRADRRYYKEKYGVEHPGRAFGQVEDGEIELIDGRLELTQYGCVSARCAEALNASRSARFEYGQSGATA